MPWRLWDVQVNRMIEPGAPFTAVTLTKVADAPKEGMESPLHSYAQGVGEGRPAVRRKVRFPEHRERLPHRLDCVLL
jgi:hypothetical protein